MQNEPTVGTMIGFSWKKSKEILFPFNFDRWFKILIIVWLAASGVHGCSLNYHRPSKVEKIGAPNVSRFSVSSLLPMSRSTKGAAAAVPPGGILPRPQRLAGSVAAPVQAPAASAVLTKLVLGTALFGVCLGLLFIWLSCRFNFVLLDVLVTRELAIWGPFHQHKELGASYFKWSLGFLGLSLGAIIGAGLFTALLVGLFKGHWVLCVIVGICGGVLTLALLLTAICIGMVAHDFVLPLMYREKISMNEAWDKFSHAGTFHIQIIAKYILVVIGLAIAAMVLQTVVVVIVALAGMVAGFLLALPGFILFKVIPLLHIPLMILGAGLVLTLALIVFLLIGMAMLPASIFFRMFALTYVTSLYPDCDLLNFKLS